MALGYDGMALQQRRAGEHERDSGDDHEREDPAVADADTVRLSVVRDSGQRERDPEDGSAGAAAERERSEALEAIAVEQQPRRGGEAGERDAETRVRQQQREDEPVEQDGPFAQPA